MTAPTRRDKLSKEGLLERESRHINREDDPHFDPTDRLAATGFRAPIRRRTLR